VLRVVCSLKGPENIAQPRGNFIGFKLRCRLTVDARGPFDVLTLANGFPVGLA
jgi:hypothetical protein